MADTDTTSNRFEKMEPGQYLDTWGSRLNAQGGSDLVDASADGNESFALSGSKTLTNNNGAADEARKRGLNVTGGTGGTITIPNVSKFYFVRNASSGDVVITTGSGTTATVESGLAKWVFSSGSNAVYAESGPNFGSANIVTTGTLATGNATVGTFAAGTSTITGTLTATNLTATAAVTGASINGSGTGAVGDFTTSGAGVIGLALNATNASYTGTAIRAITTRAGNAAFNLLNLASNGATDIEFLVNGVGTVSSDGGTAMSTPADYADMMEWADGNPDGEDRIGYSVVLVGEKVRKATADDDPEDVIGIASGNPSVCGGAAWNRWSGKFLTDDFSRAILDENGDRIVSEAFDPEAEYTPRSARREWDPIGVLGRIPMRKGCPTKPRWRKMRDISATVEEWLVH
jgi:hypothetical protein